MTEEMIERIYKEASYMLETNEVIRKIASVYNVSKSTVHKDLQERLEKLDPNLHKKIGEILKNHTETRHINGGEATKIKYLKLKK